MTLIDETIVNEMSVRFYNGIDFDMIMNHPNDGSEGFIYFFIDKWVSEVKAQERENKINSLIGKDTTKFDINEIDNNYVAIYQTDGQTMSVYEVIRNKVNNNISNYPWIPISGGDVAMMVKNRKLND